MTTLSDLPNETLLHIADYIQAPDRARLACTNRRLNAIASDPRAWDRMYRTDAGPDAYEVAKAQDKRPWKARYADIGATVRRPFLTPPGLAKKGDLVTVKALSRNDDQDTPCEVLRRLPMGALRVRPTGPGFDHASKPLTVMPWQCLDGSRPKLAAVPVECIKDWQTMQPGSMALILPSLPLRTILSTPLRAGIHVKINHLGLGTSGAMYFMVEEPKGERSLGELVSIHAANKRVTASGTGLLAKVKAFVKA